MFRKTCPLPKPGRKFPLNGWHPFNYIEMWLAKGRFPTYDPDLMRVRCFFRKAKYVYPVFEEPDPYPYVALRRYYLLDEPERRSVSLAGFRRGIPENVRNSMQEYLLQGASPEEHPGPWCIYCSFRNNLCFKSLL